MEFEFDCYVILPDEPAANEKKKRSVRKKIE
jgi:hypothetical protein